MKVRVKFFTALREIVGKSEEHVKFSRTATIEDLLRQLSKKYGKRFRDYVYDNKGEVRGHLHFLVNGKSITTLQGLKTKLKEGDTIAILPPVGGG